MWAQRHLIPLLALHLTGPEESPGELLTLYSALDQTLGQGINSRGLAQICRCWFHLFWATTHPRTKTPNPTWSFNQPPLLYLKTFES
ncbi:hypothetical protein EDB81DRAFT_796695 [Dactylonectria macrodidyma]|uniref:Uncharacterized protein n=1 Tax=Dactylonectria macrodidyma TaxID=307937 RepID=A0A9P9ETX2_9HYPO|nr:hypothetical protein EDB81DRAFT_796695 [Dactylonectria macrodidyma]